MARKLKSPLAGKHIAAIMVAFFGTVIAVNILMAALATGTFGGTVVDNSYVASQKFNGWLQQARAQDALGWQEHVALDEERHVRIGLRQRSGAMLTGATVRVLARHPLGRMPERQIGVTEYRPGLYRASAPLPAGRWIAHFTIAADDRTKRLIRELQ
jgi:nitrogen fixation protein FixH